MKKGRKGRSRKKEIVRRSWPERIVVKAALDDILQDDVIEWIADRVKQRQFRDPGQYFSVPRAY